MTPLPEPGTLEYCQAKLNEWKQQAEAAKENLRVQQSICTDQAETIDGLTEQLKQSNDEVSQLCITGRALLARAETAEARLKEAVDFITRTSNALKQRGEISLPMECDAFLAEQKSDPIPDAGKVIEKHGK